MAVVPLLALAALLPLSSAQAVSPTPITASAPHMQPDFASIVQRYGAAVVNVSVTQRPRRVAVAGNGAAPDDPREAIAELARRFGMTPPRPQTPPRGIGSGFIVRGDGVVLTNAHVVDNAAEVVVRLTDEREFAARVLGVDKVTDIAVLKIDAGGSALPTVTIGDPAALRVGDWVLAIGAPFGFDNTVTAGIVSAKARSLPDESYVPFIQTDVAINPGNSGGPLFNLDGEVIGINSQIFSTTGGFEGLSFAIPIDVADRVQQQLLSHGSVTRGRLGIATQDMTPQLAQAFGLSAARGALITGVQPDGPAALAGLRPGDVIQAVDDDEIRHSSQLPRRVADAIPGTRLRITVWRDGRRAQLDTVVGANVTVKPDDEGVPPAVHPRLGLALRAFTPAERAAGPLPDGLLIEQVEGAAALAGIEPGDVLVAINGAAIVSPADVASALARASGRVALLIQRDDGRRYVPLPLG